MDAYAVLGVHSASSDAEIREAYLRRSKDLHPDRFADATEAERALATRAMQQLNAAYDELRHREPPAEPTEAWTAPRYAPPVYQAAPVRPPRRFRWVAIWVAAMLITTVLALATGGSNNDPSTPNTKDTTVDLAVLEGECITRDVIGALEDIVDCTRPHDARVVKVVDHGAQCPLWADDSIAGPKQDLCLDRV
jgi:hypothetical protein